MQPKSQRKHIQPCDCNFFFSILDPTFGLKLLTNKNKKQNIILAKEDHLELLAASRLTKKQKTTQFPGRIRTTKIRLSLVISRVTSCKINTMKRERKHRKASTQSRLSISAADLHPAKNTSSEHPLFIFSL